MPPAVALCRTARLQTQRERMEQQDNGSGGNATDARAGVTGHNVRYVLAASLVGAIILMIAIGAFLTSL